MVYTKTIVYLSVGESGGYLLSQEIAIHLHFGEELLTTGIKLMCSIHFQMQILLQTWPKLEPEQALELLDYTFASREVRNIAVQCIEKMR